MMVSNTSYYIAVHEYKLISFTFIGPHQTLTPKLLDILKAKNAKATFFVMGIKAIIHPDIIKRAHDEGHEIANHAWNHPVMTKISLTTLHQQIQDTNDAIYNATKVLPKIMRPPYGNTNPKVNEFMAKSENLTTVIWSLDTVDWKLPKSDDIVQRVLSKVKSGDIILCHDIHPGTINAMEPLIDSLKTRGFKLVTVSDMLESNLVSKNSMITSRKRSLRH